MTDDVTIPREDAQRLIRALRARRMDDLADMLDPPAPSLRDEVAVSYRDEIIGVTRDSWDEVADHAKVRAYEFADVVIAAFLRHIEALPMRRDCGDSYRRDDVLGLLGVNR